MRGSTKRLMLALVLAAGAGACGPAQHPLTPVAGHTPVADEAPLPVGGRVGPLHEAPPNPEPGDTTGRWGGGLGSGT